ncbi:predicted protein [Naegleria gruberi]|uniref:Predicted protein n=1 Tax=Naegleria gruberi TaxID=5762 RepID=D2VX79_NAEGR|nr:uncharacterized protein NAEGRDRAFT_59479 [Naegleria gruberi]EFC38579.1 predicted protein [Naegleria gruberi]|eukprot:XP_002671323.1 predicted protein [Naegleria gruberi strain NEG-M]
MPSSSTEGKDRKKKDSSSSKKKESKDKSESKKSSSSSKTKSTPNTTTTSKDNDDDFEEKQFVLRVPEDIAEKIRERIRKESKSSSEKAQRVGLDMSIKFGDDVDVLQFLQAARLTEEDVKVNTARKEDLANGYLSDIEYGIDKNRRGRFQFGDKILPCVLVDMPTHVEAYKSIDCQTYYKCGDVSQMILVQKPSDLEADIQKSRVKRNKCYQKNSNNKTHHHHHHDSKKRKTKDLLTSYLFEDGLTSPMERVLRHWNSQKLEITRKDIKKLKEKYIQMLEEEDPTKVKIEFVEYASEQERLAALHEEMSSSSSSDSSESDEDSDDSDNLFDELSANRKDVDSVNGDNGTNNLGSSTPLSQGSSNPLGFTPFSNTPNIPKHNPTYMSEDNMSDGGESQISTMSKQSLKQNPTPSQISDQEMKDEDSSSEDESDDNDMFDEVSAAPQPSVDVRTTPQYQELIMKKESCERIIFENESKIKLVQTNIGKAKNDIQKQRANAAIASLGDIVQDHKQKLQDIINEMDQLLRR